MSNLYEASQQWATRPADERYWTVADAYKAALDYRAAAAESNVDTQDLRIYAENGEIRVNGKAKSARFSHYGFGQFARLAGAPASYLRTLPSTLAADCLVAGLANTERSSVRLLLHKQPGDDLLIRAATSEGYSRIWNSEVLEHCARAEQAGWRVPPAWGQAGEEGSRIATAEFIAGYQGRTLVKAGDSIVASGVYLSDADCFALLIDPSHRVDDGSEGGLSRGFIASNSEVGAAKFRLTTFLYRHVCGNHIIWNASDVTELAIIHKGSANKRFGSELRASLTRYANSAGSQDEAKILTCKKFTFGATRESVVKTLFDRGILPRQTLALAYDAAVVQHETTGGTGGPNSAWGYAQGITSLSQSQRHFDDRVVLDRAAGKVLDLAF
jgi:hypothetical protein